MSVLELTLEDKYRLIKDQIVEYTSNNPLAIALDIMKKDYVSIHGPEHHFIDGASFLVAYKNSGGDIDIGIALEELQKRTMKMPGAMCGLWGVCGSSTSLGSALSIIHKTGPLSDDEFYKQHMEYTSSVIKKMSEIGGPRCCKRNAFISLSLAIEFVNLHYGSNMGNDVITCPFSSKNKQCIEKRCPFYSNN